MKYTTKKTKHKDNIRQNVIGLIIELRRAIIDMANVSATVIIPDRIIVLFIPLAIDEPHSFYRLIRNIDRRTLRTARISELIECIRRINNISVAVL